MSIDINDFNEIEKATLIALADTCNYSIHAHVAEQFILSRLPSHLRGNAKKCLKKLHNKWRLCKKQPTKGNTTYYITIEGIDIAKKLRQND